MHIMLFRQRNQWLVDVGGLNPHWFPSDSSVGAPPCRYDMHVTRLAEDVLAPGQAPISFQHLPWRHLRCLRASSMNLAGLVWIPIISFLISTRHLTHLLMRQPTNKPFRVFTKPMFWRCWYSNYVRGYPWRWPLSVWKMMTNHFSIGLG